MKLSRVSKIEELLLAGNQDLGGRIPDWIENVSSKLRKLDLGGNSFQGEIPESLLHLRSLEHLDLSSNRVGGLLLDFDGSQLVFLDFASNNLTGALPCFFASDHALSILNPRKTLIIVRGIPTCISFLRVLQQLNLSSNGLNFKISPLLIFSDLLLVLDLSSNDLYSPLPAEISKTSEKSGLVLLDLSRNQFSGRISLGITDIRSFALPQRALRRDSNFDRESDLSSSDLWLGEGSRK